LAYPLQAKLSVRSARHYRGMWQVLVACSGCDEDSEVVVEKLDDVDREACPCGYSYVVLSVSSFEPVYAQRAQVVELPRRRKLSKAA
jgi:hypothetical protein